MSEPTERPEETANPAPATGSLPPAAGPTLDAFTPTSASDPSAATLAHPDLSFLGPAPRPGVLGSLGPYEILRIVGCGGMGLVFEAFDPALKRRVAVKVLAAELATSGVARKRFLR